MDSKHAARAGGDSHYTQCPSYKPSCNYAGHRYSEGLSDVPEEDFQQYQIIRVLSTSKCPHTEYDSVNQRMVYTGTVLPAAFCPSPLQPK